MHKPQRFLENLTSIYIYFFINSRVCFSQPFLVTAFQKGVAEKTGDVLNTFAHCNATRKGNTHISNSLILINTMSHKLLIPHYYDNQWLCMHHSGAVNVFSSLFQHYIRIQHYESIS